MITIPLPRPKEGRININTFEYEYADHPVLEISSSYSTLKYEVRGWLKKQGMEYTFLFEGDYYVIKFLNDKDATMFCLRWL